MQVGDERLDFIMNIMFEDIYTKVSCYLIEVMKTSDEQKPPESKKKDNMGEKDNPREKDKQDRKDKRIEKEREDEMNNKMIEKYLLLHIINKKGSGRYKKWLGKLAWSPKNEPPRVFDTQGPLRLNDVKQITLWEETHIFVVQFMFCFV